MFTTNQIGMSAHVTVTTREGSAASALVYTVYEQSRADNGWTIKPASQFDLVIKDEGEYAIVRAHRERCALMGVVQANRHLIASCAGGQKDVM
jgi:hypothetical protein